MVKCITMCKIWICRFNLLKQIRNLIFIFSIDFSNKRRKEKTMNCSCCKYSKDDCFEYVVEKRGLLNLLKHHPKDIILEIAKYILHYDFHEVIHTIKRRVRPSFMNFDEDGEYYYTDTKWLCTWCFQLSIIHCLEVNHHLPKMRFEITYFMNTKRDSNLEELYKDEIDFMFTNYHLPKCYVVDFYRQSQPKQMSDDTLVIFPNKE